MNEVEAAKKYFQEELTPRISQIFPIEDLCVALGGSVSFGFNDEHSDVDVYLFWHTPQNGWLPKLKDYFFEKKLIHGHFVQYIPIDLDQNVDEVLRNLFSDETEINIPATDDAISKLHEVSNYIVLHDPKYKISRAQSRIEELEEKWWIEACHEKCSEQIEVLEALYACGKRNDIVSSVILFGQALDGIMKILYLSAEIFFPFGKWLYRGLQAVDEAAYIRIGKFLKESNNTTEELTSFTKDMMNWTVDRLKCKVDLPDYLITYLLNP